MPETFVAYRLVIDYSLIIGNNQWLINWLPIDYPLMIHWCHWLDIPGISRLPHPTKPMLDPQRYPSGNSTIRSTVQWNPDITLYQGTGKITSLYRGSTVIQVWHVYRKWHAANRVTPAGSSGTPAAVLTLMSISRVRSNVKNTFYDVTKYVDWKLKKRNATIDWISCVCKSEQN